MSDHAVVELSPIQASPRRIDGAVVEKGGLITVTFTKPGSSKPKVESFDTESVSAYMVGTPGFVVVPSTGVMATFVGKLGEKNGKKALKTEAGLVYFNSLPTVNVSIQNVDSDSKEARAAERASRVKVRLPKSVTGGDSTRPAKSAKVAAKAGKAEKSGKKAAPVEEKRGRGRPPATDKAKSARTEATPKRRARAV